MGGKIKIILLAGFLFISFTASADDSLIFEPIIGGINADALVQSTPNPNTWLGWCGIRIQQQKKLNQSNRSEQTSYYITTDGQRIAGKFELDTIGASWRSGILLSTPIDLEKTLSIGSFTLGQTKQKSKDSVHLVNNDCLDGFVNSIDMTNGVGIELGDPKENNDVNLKNKITYIPIHRVAEIRLSTQPKKPTGWRFWLVDGSILDADSWTDVQNQCRLNKPHVATEMESASTPWTNILGMAPNTNTIYPLTASLWKSIDVDQNQNPRLSPPTITTEFIATAFDAMPMNIHGPGVFRFATPTPNCTLATSIHIPPQLIKNIECRVTITCGSKTLWQSKINSQFKPICLRLPITQGEFTIQLDESTHGAFGCAIQLKDAILISDTCGNVSQPNTPPPTAPTKSEK